MSTPARRPTHTNHMEIKSESSSRVYIVAQRISTGLWECSCPGWKGYRKCKHLTKMGLPSVAPITPAPKGMGSGDNFGFSDAAYAHYDIRDGYGSADEWMRQAEEHAAGRGRYRGTGTDRWYSSPSDMELMGLTAMPATVKGLVRAMRAKAKVLHPDFGGDAKAFSAMIMAYERLLKQY